MAEMRSKGVVRNGVVVPMERSCASRRRSRGNVVVAEETDSWSLLVAPSLCRGLGKRGRQRLRQLEGALWRFREVMWCSFLSRLQI
jgi:hypothetical protein